MQEKIQLVATRGLLWNIEVKQVRQNINMMSSNYKMSCSTPDGSIWQLSSIRILSATEAIHLTIITNSLSRNCFGGCSFKKKLPALHFRQCDPFTESLMCIVHPILPSMEWTQRNFSSWVLVIIFVLCSSFQDPLVSPPNVTKLAKLTTPPLLAPPAGAPLYPPPLAAPEWKED